ncbi:unnamed protein product, partial [Didymodactylos carnosus]
ALFACRVRVHQSTGRTPFFMVYGVEPKIPGDELTPILDDRGNRGQRQDQLQFICQNATIVAGGNAYGAYFDQLSYPYRFSVDFNNNLHIADLSNDRILKWNVGAATGQIIGPNGDSGKGSNQL